MSTNRLRQRTTNDQAARDTGRSWPVAGVLRPFEAVGLSVSAVQLNRQGAAMRWRGHRGEEECLAARPLVPCLGPVSGLLFP